MASKFQMVLPDDLSLRLRVMADSRKIPVAQFIRETMEARLGELEKADSSQGIFIRLRGLGAGIPENDLSTTVDLHLYGSGSEA